MDQETFNALIIAISLIGVLGGIVSFIWNIINFIIGRREQDTQQKETEKLTRLTSDLNRGVQLLSRQMDQRLALLHRARDVVLKLNSIHHELIAIGRGLDLRSKMINKGITGVSSGIENLDANLKLDVERENTFAELGAIFRTLNDEVLNGHFYSVVQAVNERGDTQSSKAFEDPSRFRVAIMDTLSRIFQLQIDIPTA